MADIDQQCDRILAARILLKLMKIMGLWQWKKEGYSETKNPYEKYYFIFEYAQRIIIHVPFSFIFLLLLLIGVFVATDMDQAGAVLYMFLTQVGVSIKILTVWYYSDKAWNFINELTYSETYKFLHLEEAEVWQKKQKQFRNVIFIFLFTSICSGIAAFSGVLFLEEYKLPFDYWVPFDFRASSRNYWIAYFYNMGGIYVTMFANIGNDMMGCYMMLHISLLYKVVGLRLARLKADKENNTVKELFKILSFHRNVKRMTKECETLIAPYALSQIVLSALILCFCCYRIVKMSIFQNIGQFFALLQFLGVMVLEIFLPCYYANEITINSSELCNQIYSSDWLEFSMPTRKFMNLYMEFLKHPEKLKAANYFEVGLPIFTKVVNNAYTFFALLMNVEN